jgi:galactose mutarotase-like enzyme
LTLTLQAGDAQLTLAPTAGGRASALVLDGLDVLGRNADTPVGWGWYPMAPWPGRLRENSIHWAGRTYPMPANEGPWALHGTVLDVAWEIEHAGRAEATLGVDLADPWPWQGRVRQLWRLTPGALETVITISSETDTFPAEIGWHPWFRTVLDRGGPARLDPAPTVMYERGADYLPTGTELSPPPPPPYDDAFALRDGRVGIHWPGALRLVCHSDCRYVVVFDERPGLLCVEPQTALPDGINAAPGLVRPGVPRTARAVWSWSPG